MPPTVRDILKERIEVGRQSVGMVAVTLQAGRRELVTWVTPAPRTTGRSTCDSLFEIGSITKVFTALLLADMVQRREVALDDPVARSAGREDPRERQADHAARPRDHISGLPRLPGNFAPAIQDPYADYTEAKLLEFLATYELKHEPGAHSEYSNLGFGLLGTRSRRTPASPTRRL